MRRHVYSDICTGGSRMLIISLFLTSSALAADAAYDQLIIQARNGQTADLLNWLHTENKHHGLNSGQVADWLQVAQWAGQDQETMTVWRQYHGNVAIPARGVVAAARASRNLKQWPQSLALWDLARTLKPTDDDIRSGWILTLADAKQDARALKEARALVDYAPEARSYQVLAYVLRRQGKSRDALLAITKAHEAQPGNKQIDRDLVEIWSAGRISQPALALGQTLDLPAAQQRRLALDRAAELVRIAQMPARGEAERFSVADRALACYRPLLARWREQPDASADYRQARVDRLGALLARQRYAEVITEYEALRGEGKPLPRYADRWVGLAMMAMQRPAEASALLSREPDGVESERFYAALESEDFPAAKQLADMLAASSPYQLRQYGSPVLLPNDKWLTARTLQNQYLLAANALPAAQRESAALMRRAPGNQGLIMSYAAVLSARGLPRAAEQQLKRAEVLEPSSLALEREQAWVARTLQEWSQFEQLIDDVVTRSPQEPATRQLARARDIHHMYELRIEGNKGISSDSPVSGTRDFNWQSLLYGPPLGEHYRLFAGFNFATGQFEEGKGYNRTVQGGVEYTARNLWLQGQLSRQNNGHGNKPGARLEGWYDISDHWRAGAAAERLAAATPLRALRNGITANSAQGYLRWYQHERREYQFTLSPSHFSDGNRRMEYGLSGKERLWTSPYVTLDIQPSLSASTNTRQNVPYYNPKRDVSASASVSAQHIMYRHYDRIWSQQLLGGLGNYWQKDQRAGLITVLGYGQRVQWNNVLDIGVMAIRDKRPYDGVRERNLSVVFDMTLRF